MSDGYSLIWNKTPATITIGRSCLVGLRVKVQSVKTKNSVAVTLSTYSQGAPNGILLRAQTNLIEVVRGFPLQNKRTPRWSQIQTASTFKPNSIRHQSCARRDKTASENNRIFICTNCFNIKRLCFHGASVFLITHTPNDYSFYTPVTEWSY